MAGAVAQVFYVLYKALTKDLVEGNKEAQKSTKGLAKELKEQDKFTKDLQKSFKGLAVEIAGALGVAYTAGEFFRSLKDAADFGKTLSLTSNMLNINAGELQAWGNIIQKVGGTAEQFRGDLKNVADYFGTTQDNAFRLLPMLADNLHRLNRMQAFTYGHSIGLSDETITLLRKGNVELSSMLMAQKALGLITELDVKKFAEFNNTVADTKNAFMGLTLGLVSEAIPGLNKLFEETTKGLIYLRKHSSEFGDAFKGIAISVVAALALVNPEIAIFVAAIAALVAGLDKLKQMHDSFKPTGNAISDVFQGLSLGDVKDGKLSLSLKGRSEKTVDAIQAHNAEVQSAAALGTSNSINSSSKATTINNNVKIDKVVANSPTELARNIQSASGFSPAFLDQTGQANNTAANGMQ